MDTIGLITEMYGLSVMASMEAEKEEWKKRIRKQWAESRNLPRKKKKSVRKSLIVDWSIASWNPFEINNS